MKTLHLPKQLLLLALWSTAAITAHAQWQWMDDAGRKVFSDRPPPPRVPASKVLRKPAGNTVGADSADKAGKPAVTAGDAMDRKPLPTPGNEKSVEKGAKPIGTDPTLEQKKAEQEAREAQEKLVLEQKQARQRQENCNRARSNQAVMQSGQMLSHTNANGERGFLDDATRQQELARNQQVIDSECR